MHEIITFDTIKEWRNINELNRLRAIDHTEKAKQGHNEILEFIKRKDSIPEASRQTEERLAFYREVLSDSFYDGFAMTYPHGNVVKQPTRDFFYRGENNNYPLSQPSLSRHLKTCKTDEEREVEIIIAQLRVNEFVSLLNKFSYLEEFHKHGITIQGSILAQHYGLKTFWLDITNDFEVALFFACCKYTSRNQWEPLSRKDITNTYYSTIYRAPEYLVRPHTSSDIANQSPSVLPIGYQPFYRCSNQTGYACLLPSDMNLLEHVAGFKKYLFKQDSMFCKKVFENMEGGKLIYPNEGLNSFTDQIEIIAECKYFSEESIREAVRTMNMEYHQIQSKIERYGYRVVSHPVFQVNKEKVERLNQQYLKNSPIKHLEIKTRQVF